MNNTVYATLILFGLIFVWQGNQLHDQIDELNARLTIHYNELQEMKK